MSLHPDDDRAVAAARHGIDQLCAHVDTGPVAALEPTEHAALRKCLASANDLLTLCEGLLEGTDGLSTAERERRIDRLVDQAKHVAHRAYDTALTVTGDPAQAADEPTRSGSQ
ncbi:Uncharacterised protein [Xylophilus ampelinus]|nr:hypothetical protein [Variovorax sp.]VTY30999.1 Uncharacterised protein [Xylophilus ampelinus]|tara:strand:- start:340 stop:678 length:339 start_codon:yes stop_codon:yes gene_type:complete